MASGRAVVESAVVSGTPVLGWRNKWFMQLLMPRFLSVRSPSEIVHKIAVLESQPEKYAAMRRGIASRLKFVDLRGGLEASQLADFAAILGRGHQNCKLNSKLFRSNPNSLLVHVGQGMGDDTLSSAVSFARNLLCLRPPPSLQTSFANHDFSSNFMVGSCDRNKIATDACRRDGQSCNQPSESHSISFSRAVGEKGDVAVSESDSRDWVFNVYEMLQRQEIETALQAVAWRVLSSPLDDAAWIFLSASLVQLSQRAGEDLALALVLYRAGEVALKRARQSRRVTGIATDVDVITEEMMWQVPRWFFLRNLTAAAWADQLERTGCMRSVDAWAREQAANLWQM